MNRKIKFSHYIIKKYILPQFPNINIKKILTFHQKAYSIFMGITKTIIFLWLFTIQAPKALDPQIIIIGLLVLILLHLRMGTTKTANPEEINLDEA